MLWELAEYIAFVPNSPEAATAYADTLLDLALGMVGGLIAAVVTSRLPLIDRTVRPAAQSAPMHTINVASQT